MDVIYFVIVILQYFALGLLIYIWRHEMDAKRMLSLLTWVFLTQVSLFVFFDKIENLSSTTATSYISKLHR